MNQLTTPFKLHAPNLSADSHLNPSDDLPAEVAGQPATYLWKDMIHSGNYVHPSRDFSLAVDGDRLAKWAESGQRMLAAGLAVPINCDHSDSARDVVGYVKEFKLDGDRLLGLCQFIGQDAALTAARNLVSVGVDPNFIDGEGRNWGEAIVHLALTPVPVVTDQDQFVKTQETYEDDDEPSMDSDQTIPANPTPEPEPSESQLLQLSAASRPSSIPPDIESAIAELAAAKFDLAVERGSISPVARDRLVAALVRGGDGKPNILTLSRSAGAAGGQSLAMTVAEILLESGPIQLGEVTGLQAISRQIPGDEQSPIDQLRQYMTKIASVSG